MYKNDRLQTHSINIYVHETSNRLTFNWIFLLFFKLAHSTNTRGEYYRSINYHRSNKQALQCNGGECRTLPFAPSPCLGIKAGNVGNWSMSSSSPPPLPRLQLLLPLFSSFYFWFNEMKNVMKEKILWWLYL